VSPPANGAIGGTYVGTTINITNLLDGADPAPNFVGTILLGIDGIPASFSGTDNNSGATVSAVRAKYAVDMPGELAKIRFTDPRLNGAGPNGPYDTWMFFADDSYAVVASNDHSDNMLLNQICVLTQPDNDHTSFAFTLGGAQGDFVAGPYTFVFMNPTSNDPSGFGGNVVDPLLQRPDSDDDGWMAESKPGT
jgi:hypothetical protein